MIVVNTRTKIFMVVTQEPATHTHTHTYVYIIKKNSCYLCISHHGMIYCYKHHHAKPKILCTVAWGHATSQVGGNVELQKYHILFIFHIPFITLFLSYPSIKSLISTIFMNKYGLPCYFPNNLFLSILSEFVVKY